MTSGIALVREPASPAITGDYDYKLSVVTTTTSDFQFWSNPSIWHLWSVTLITRDHIATWWMINFNIYFNELYSSFLHCGDVLCVYMISLCITYLTHNVHRLIYVYKFLSFSLIDGNIFLYAFIYLWASLIFCEVMQIFLQFEFDFFGIFFLHL